jgi:hypothetical protein
LEANPGGGVFEGTVRVWEEEVKEKPVWFGKGKKKKGEVNSMIRGTLNG